MLRLASVIYAIAGPTLMGILLIAALVSGHDTMKYVIISVAIGAVIALPVSYFVAGAIKAND